MRTQRGFGVVMVCVLGLALVGCGKKEEQGQTSGTAQAPAQAAQPQTPGTQPAATPAAASSEAAPATPAAPDYAKMAEQNRQTLVQMNQGKEVQAVAGATLKDLLPSELPGMKRTKASSEKVNTMGVDMSKAEGRYEAADGGEARMRITFTDLGNLTGPMRTTMVAWTAAQYNRETDSGYEKTTTYSDCKAVEKYNTGTHRGSLRVFVADRFVVEAEGTGLTMDAIKEMLGKVDLKKLATAGS
jgi:hypothetical protein